MFVLIEIENIANIFDLVQLVEDVVHRFGKCLQVIFVTEIVAELTPFGRKCAVVLAGHTREAMVLHVEVETAPVGVEPSWHGDVRARADVAVDVGHRAAGRVKLLEFLNPRLVHMV